MTAYEHRVAEYLRAYLDGRHVTFRDPEYMKSFLTCQNMLDILWVHPGREFRIED